jgi:hypothetical protein
MKSAYIIDTPEKCSECKLFMGECDKLHKEDGRPDDCPLKDIPVRQLCNEYDFEHYQNGVSVGMNIMIDFLCGQRDWKVDNRI